jgi:hypothetical protein
MKSNFLLIGTMFLFIAFGFTSCSDDDGGSSGSASAGTVKATIDGQSYQSDEMLTSANYVESGLALNITANNMNGQNLTFVVNGFDRSTGTFEIGGDNLIAIVATYTEVDTSNISNPTTESWVAPFDDTSVRGTISFSTVTDTTIEGTFEFTAKNNAANLDDTIEVTNGSFNLDYTTF